MSAWHSVMLPVSWISLPSPCVSSRSAATGSLLMIVEFCHCGSVIVVETTGLCIASGSSDIPAGTSDWGFQEPGQAANVFARAEPPCDLVRPSPVRCTLLLAQRPAEG